ncbi:hypothetical protein J2X36_002540 [Methylobacterium sp. BE186]|uniref:hypothetical protein n=1 Tax=Methylobacterium sp. BE186 TaxID=2817715 RepID=UPI002859CFF1|nr:hypothetical protein [Methylobacterium sp. BE186]MDR7037789.1 hypothetical protein [Methylobacterium sp. BE186]
MAYSPLADLSFAALCVSEGARRCDLQRALIAYLRSSRHDTAAAETTLASFEQALRFMRERQQRLWDLRQLP